VAKNYKLTIQYDGTNYHGWQFQREKPTIQDTITNVIQTLIKEKINLNGAGRTDSGVHALGQVANFRCEQKLDLYKFTYSLNSILPKDIAVKEIIEVDEGFHARFDAKRRIYFYLINNTKSPFYNRYSYFYTKKISIEKLNELSKCLIGNFDFSSFARKTSEETNNFCTIYEAKWKSTKGLTLFKIEADRYLHGMVRAITGTLLEFEKDNLPAEELSKILQDKDRESAGISIPAKGLFLFKVKY
jgi:tRNA pseudouridine38-40 synthase